MEHKIIAIKEPLGPTEKPYAYRWVINFGLFAFRIHKWICSDDDRAMHDHPYWMLIFVVKGGYKDVTPDGAEELKAGSVRFRRAKHIHTVQLVTSPTWTFLITGPALRRWGFWVGGKWRRSERYFEKFGHHQCEV